MCDKIAHAIRRSIEADFTVGVSGVSHDKATDQFNHMKAFSNELRRGC